MKIIYVHHGLRDRGNPPSDNDGLLDLGKKDAENVAEFLLIAKNKGQNIRAIYTSPYFRCKKTAEIINEKLNVPVFDEPRFNEFNDVYAYIKGDAKDKGERWKGLQESIIDAIKEIVNKYDEDKNDCVICVTSGVNVTAFIDLAYGLEPSEKRPFPMVPSCSPIGFEITKEMCK